MRPPVFFLTQHFIAAALISTLCNMASVLGNLYDASQLQRAPAAPNTTSSPRIPQNPLENTENDPSSDDDSDAQTPSTARNPSDMRAAFALRTARNIQLTPDGEKSLIQFSQVYFSSSHNIVPTMILHASSLTQIRLWFTSKQHSSN
jgi:hypothetical protein